MDMEESEANWTQCVAFKKKFESPSSPPNRDKTIEMRSIEHLKKKL